MVFCIITGKLKYIYVGLQEEEWQFPAQIMPVVKDIVAHAGFKIIKVIYFFLFSHSQETLNINGQKILKYTKVYITYVYQNI